MADYRRVDVGFPYFFLTCLLRPLNDPSETGDIRVKIPHQANSISLSDWVHNTGERTAREVETPEVEISQTAKSKETSGKKVRFDLPK